MQFKISAESSAIITNDNVGINPTQVERERETERERMWASTPPMFGV